MSIELVLILLLIVKHFFADFPLQSYSMVCEKGIYAKKGGLIHSGIHAIFTFVILYFFTPYAIVLALLDFVLHYHIDYAKMNLSKQYTPNDPKFWTWLGLDQLLHYVTYVIIVVIAV